MPSDHSKAQPASNWRRYFTGVSKLNSSLSEAPSEHAKSIKIGKFLSGCLGRPVPIQVHGRTGVATLRSEIRPSGNTKAYFFEVDWNAPEVEKSSCTEPPLGVSERDENEAPVISKPAGAGAAAKAKPAKKTPKAARSSLPPAKPPTKGNSERWD